MQYEYIYHTNSRQKVVNVDDNLNPLYYEYTSNAPSKPTIYMMW